MDRSASAVIGTINAERLGLHLEEESLGVMGHFEQHAQVCILIKPF